MIIQANNQKSLPTLLVHFQNHLEPVFGEKCAERLRTWDIEEYKTHRKKEGAANATINLELAAMRRAFNLGIAQELIEKAPKVTLFRVGKTNRRKGFFEPDLYEEMLRSVKPYMKPVLRFGFLSGWREGEIFKLRWDLNYDLDSQVIRIYDSKNQDGKALPLLDEDGHTTELSQLLLTQLYHHREQFPGVPWIFHNEGRQINRTTFNKHWRKAARPIEERIGRRIFFHDLRRTAVRNLTRAGVPRVIAKEITGHRTDDVYDRYDIVDEDDVKKAFTKVSRYLKKNNGVNKNGSREQGNHRNRERV